MLDSLSEFFLLETVSDQEVEGRRRRGMCDNWLRILSCHPEQWVEELGVETSSSHLNSPNLDK